MVKVVNEILELNDETLISLYYKIYFNKELIGVVYCNETIEIMEEVYNKEQLLKTIKKLYTQNLSLLPLGSIVKIDNDKMGLNIDLSNTLFVITNRIALLDSEIEFYDYELIEYPFGMGATAEKLYVSSELVSEVIFEGYNDKLEIEYLSRLRLNALQENLVSRIFTSIEKEQFRVEV